MAWAFDPVTGQWSTNPHVTTSALSGYQAGAELPPSFWQQMMQRYGNGQETGEYTDPATGLNFAPKFREVAGNQIFDGGTVYKVQGKGTYDTPGDVFDAGGKLTTSGFNLHHDAPNFMDKFGPFIPLLAPFAASAMGLGGAAGGAGAGGLTTAQMAGVGSSVIPEGAAFIPATAGEMGAMGVSAGAAGGAMGGALGADSLAQSAFDKAVAASGVPYDMTSVMEVGGSAAGGAAGSSSAGGGGAAATPKTLSDLANSNNGKMLLQGASLAASGLGSGSTAADFAAQQQEVEDKKKAARDQLNFFFQGDKGGRDQLYQKVRDDAFTAGKRTLDEDRADAARKLKFELFARGLQRGSEDVDQNARLGRTYNKGLLDLGARADATKAGFRSDDENTRLSLLQSIDAGMDQGTALSTASQRMQAAADKAAADANGTSVGDLFDTAGLMYSQGQMARGQADARAAFPMFSQQGRSTRKSSATTGSVARLPGE